jgi:hypothetical protein
MWAESCPHVECDFGSSSRRHSWLQRSQTGRLRKRGASSAVGRVQARCEAAKVAWPRSPVLDRAKDDLGGLEVGAGNFSWHRNRFKRYWRQLSRPNMPGRPPVTGEIRKLVRTMASANPLWGAPRVHGELLKLGFEISERTVSRLMPKKERKHTQTWMTFLRNHAGQIVSIDLFTVVTIQLRVLYVFIVLAHDRRRVVHFNVTKNPTAVWAAQQIVEAFPENTAPRYLV